MKRVLTLLILIFMLSGCRPAAGTTDRRGIPDSQSLISTKPQITGDISVLFIGNSYTYANDLPEMFAQLARSGGREVQGGTAAEGGWSLSDHTQSAETLGQLRSRPWTFVVLQEQSQIPSLETYRTQDMYPAARELVSLIRETGATPVFFLTWAHRDGWPGRGMIDYESMQLAVEKGYQEIALELDVPLAPVGRAWRAALREHPELPLWQEDGNHPGEQGSYLAACVFYAVIFQQSPAGLAYRAGLPDEIAQTLQNIAAATALKPP